MIFRDITVSMEDLERRIEELSQLLAELERRLDECIQNTHNSRINL